MNIQTGIGLRSITLQCSFESSFSLSLLVVYSKRLGVDDSEFIRVNPRASIVIGDSSVWDG